MLLNRHADGGNPVETAQRPLLFHAVLCPSDVPDAHRCAFIITDDQVVEIGNLGKLALDPDGVFFGPGFNTAARKFNVFTLQGHNDVSRRHLIGLHLGGIEPDAHLPEPQPIENDVADAINPLQLFFQNFIRVSRKITNGTLPRKIQHENRRGIGIHLGNLGFINIVGQFVADPGHFFPHILNGLIDIPLQNEFDRRARHTFIACRCNTFDAVNGIDGAFDSIGYVHIHHVGTGAFKLRPDGHNGKIDFREQIDADVRITDHPQHHQGHDHHGGKDRAFDGGISEPHAPSLLPTDCSARPRQSVPFP